VLTDNTSGRLWSGSDPLRVYSLHCLPLLFLPLGASERGVSLHDRDQGCLQEHVPYQVTNTCDLSHSQVVRRVAFEDLESHMTTPKLWGAHETDLLNRAADKLVCYAQKVGVSPDEMISLLDSGMSIRDLLLFLASKDSRRAHE